ncbi:MAG: TerC family protein, partial [Myxococcales bacterium]|nr:TerC family protein [Myxococcales bacterium]
MLVDWLGFFIILGLLLVLDLKVIHKDPHAIGMREATRWSIIWISIGVAFSGVIYLVYELNWGGAGRGAGGSGIVRDGATATWEYLTAFLIEKSLSVDNIFVMSMLFTYFKVPAKYQHKVLYWGILGALVFRGIMIAVGTALVREFDWIFYIFGAFLLFTAVRMILQSEDEHFDPSSSRLVRWAKRVFPLVERYEGGHFRVKVDGKHYFTLLFLAVVVIEGTDVVFAVDSIPAVFGVTDDPFIVMTSNVFAILGLRALYFVVAGAMEEYRYLKQAVSAILVLVALKMLAHDLIHVDSKWSLVVVVVILAVGVVASIMKNRQEERHEAAQGGDGDGDGDSDSDGDGD